MLREDVDPKTSGDQPMTVLNQPLMSDVADSFLLVYAALFPIVNPVGTAPVFLSLTRHGSAAARHALAGRVAINGFLLLLGSLFVGSHILQFFGITLPIVRIAGGFVVTAMGWQLLKEGEGPLERPAARAPRERDSPDEESEQQVLEEAFYPLTMPLTVGPGSIATAITLGSQRPLVTGSFGHLALIGGAAVVGLLAVAATIYVCYRFAENIEPRLGKSGTNVLVRLSAFVLMCIGIQIMWNGYSGLVGAAALKGGTIGALTVVDFLARV